MIINCTPHPVTMCDDNGVIYRTFPRGEIIPRLSVIVGKANSIDGIPTTKSTFSECLNLPQKKKGVFYIVSQMVKNAYPNRKDFLVPTEIVRDKNNNIIGCKSLGR